eukprot:TRINITY_DN141018_c0_g1_i1.p2 TRINITY_DN141018_c0_g1~~TRINITY_DN141018_c0_g1_i1.p2  ORF type:complete len:226 (-),score=69.24 TRINITY_DN141018_c0_g1_i1:47-724(-)
MPKGKRITNDVLGKGIRRFGRNKAQKLRHKFFTRKLATKFEKKAKPVVKKQKAPFHIPKTKTNGKKKHHKTALKAGLTAGSVVILLAGRFRGHRAVFLKQLDSGLLLITGPYKVNGIPLRRVNQRYVIVTSTKVDVPALKFNDKLNDALFKKPKAAKAPKDKELLPDAKGVAKKEKKPIAEERKALQKEVDEQLLPAIKKQQLLIPYLRSVFTLTRGQRPHLMKF